ncbi:MAG: rRNA maturation RNase YbeY [Bacteroidales bacterium]|nr:rRNA maturation RNase YbeY [Bacteroidales bacterium]
MIKWITKVIQQRNKQVGNIHYLFCTDDYMLTANQRYLNHDTYTDIITFDYVVGNLISGDILLNIDRVKENAIGYDTTFERELLRVIIHGVLHLLGQGDKSEAEAKEMRRLEGEAMQLWEQMFPVEQWA